MDTSLLAQLHELQQNEVEVLQAIYMDDFKPVTTATAWKIVEPQPANFKIRLLPHGEDELRKFVSIDLHVRFRQTYPVVAPEVHLENAKGLSKVQVQELTKVVDAKVKELVGQEMVYELCTTIQDHMVHNNSNIRAKHVSSHKQMLDRMEKMNKEEQERTQQEQGRLQRLAETAQHDEDLALTQEIQEELKRKEEKIRTERNRRKQRRREIRSTASDLEACETDDDVLPVGVSPKASLGRSLAASADNQRNPNISSPMYAFRHVQFDELVSVDDEPTHRFLAVAIGLPLSHDPQLAQTVYAVQPLEPECDDNELDSSSPPCSPHNRRWRFLALKEVHLQAPLIGQEAWEMKLAILETELTRLKMIRHPGIVPMYAAKIEPRDQGLQLSANGRAAVQSSRVCSVYLLMELVDGGSLHDLLIRCGGRLNISDDVNGGVAKRYMSELLHALAHLHACGFVHQNIKATNVLLQDFSSYVHSARSNVARAKFTDVLYCQTVKQLQGEGENSSLWHAPELANQRNQLGKKNDIWCLGVVFAQMLLGLDVTRMFKGPAEMLERLPHSLPQVLVTLLTKMLAQDPKRRPSALELLAEPFFLNVAGGGTRGFGSPLDIAFSLSSGRPIVSTRAPTSENFPLGNTSAENQENAAALALATQAAANTATGTQLSSPAADRQVDFKLTCDISRTIPKFNGFDPSTLSVRRSESLPSPQIEGQLAFPIVYGTTPTETASQGIATTSPANNSSRNLPQLSRYRLDFEEIEFLGRGGFGEVVKARNRLDGRLYAIKKVRLNPLDINNNRKILREVTALSRLQHAYVVRYFSTWVEDLGEADWASMESMSDGSEMEESGLDESASSFSARSLSVAGYRFTQAAFDNEHLRFVDDFLSAEGDRSKNYAAAQFANADATSDDGTVDVSESESAEETDATRSPPLTTRNAERKSTSPEKWPCNKASTPAPMRMLYIQMEYCEKKTLRDVIDEGVEEDEAWRYLRQILEGLVHIHGQGMIHRDLKPSNVFLDANGNVKIGDFGLATSTSLGGVELVYSKHASFEKESYDAQTAGSIPGDSLTSGVGTTLYVAPEVTTAQNGSRYNQKVDMYSLGIIFFELCFRFDTGMERILTLRDLRKPEIVLPKDFLSSGMKNQGHIIRWLLQHDPKDRPTSAELLQSEYLPPKLEDEYIQECVRAIANPNTPYYTKLMTALFAQPDSKHRDYTYDFNSDNPGFDQYRGLFYVKIREYMTAIFRRHGALELDTPLLMPKLDLYDADKKPVNLMDLTGGIVQLPYDLTVPFARYVARNGIFSLKRYTFGHVYRENIVGGQPRTVSEVDFDIVDTTQAQAVADAEILKMLDDLLDGLPPIHATGFSFHISHYSIIEAILENFRIPNKDRQGVCAVLTQFGRGLSRPQLRARLVEHFRIPRSIVDKLEACDIQGDVELVATKLERLIIHERAKGLLQEGIQHLRTVAEYANIFAVRHRIVFMPLLIYNRYFYQDGIMFQAVRGSKRHDVLAAGGRYDRLIRRFRHPGLDRSTKTINAVGVHIAIAKIIDAVNNYHVDLLKNVFAKKAGAESRSFGLWAPKKCDVYVASFSRSLLKERMAVVKDLWAANIKADFHYLDDGHALDSMTPEQLSQLCRYQGINWIVIVKGRSAKSTGPSSVKVKNILRKTETEVLRTDLAIWLQGEMNEQARLDHALTGAKYRKPNTAGPSPLDYGPPQKHDALPGMTSGPSYGATNRDFTVMVVSRLNQRNKLSHGKKNILIEKATANISQFMDDIAHIPVLAVDFGRDVLRKIIQTNVLDDESAKRAAEYVPTSQKDYLFYILRKMNEEYEHRRLRYIFLYSLRDDWRVLYEFFT